MRGRIFHSPINIIFSIETKVKIHYLFISILNNFFFFFFFLNNSKIITEGEHTFLKHTYVYSRVAQCNFYELYCSSR